MHHGYWNGGWGNGGTWIPMVLMMILFWGSIAWLGVTLLRRTTPPAASHGPHPAPPPPAPLPDPAQILAERLARGEIDVDDYHQRLDALGRAAPRPLASDGPDQARKAGPH